MLLPIVSPFKCWKKAEWKEDRRTKVNDNFQILLEDDTAGGMRQDRDRDGAKKILSGCQFKYWKIPLNLEILNCQGLPGKEEPDRISIVLKEKVFVSNRLPWLLARMR